METPLMISNQQLQNGLWHLGKGRAMRLEIGPGPRHLRLREGRLWLTSEGAPDAPPDDIWLQPGDAVALPSGTRLVAEGWPRASFELVVPPQACASKVPGDAA